MTSPPSIVVGIDGRPGGWDGLALARRLGRLTDARLTIVCAYPALGFEHARLMWATITAESDAGRVLDDARERLAGADDVDLLAVAGAMPATCLRDVARERDADLLVVGGTTHGPLGRVLGAGVLSGLLAAPPCPVAVAPRGKATGIARMHRVGVAVDGTTEAAAALHWARELAGAHDEIQELQLIAVDGHAADATPVGRGELLVPAGGPHGRGAAQPALRWTHLCGSVAHELAAFSVQLDLLVVGTHGRAGIARALRGSVSRGVAQHARCPVVVVPAA